MSEIEESQRHGQLWETPYDLTDISDQAKIVHLLIDRVEPQIAAVVTPELAEKTRQIYITGCGDSYFAGYAARLAFEKYGRIQTEPIEALEFSRYKVDYMSADSLVVSISNSGQVKRTVEGVRLAKKRGALTIAITGTPEGPLALEADRALIQSVPEMTQSVGPNNVVALGLGNFTASLLTLYMFAIRLGVLRGVMSAEEAQKLKAELISSADIISATSQADFPVARQLAAALWNLEHFVIVGGGPSYATSMFIAAKLMEQPQKRGAPQMLEEWAHLDYFLVRPMVTPTFFIVPPGKSRDRAIEQIHGAKDMGATIITICDSEDREIQELSDWRLPVHGALSEEFSPLTYIVPGQIFATSMHRLVGRKPFIPPYTEQKMEEINYRQIWQGGILDE